MQAILILGLLLVFLPGQDPTLVKQSEADYARAVKLQQSGDLDGARAAYEAALKSYPNRPDALANLGVIYAKLGQYAKAIDYYKRALAVDSTMIEIRLNLGLSYFKIEDFDGAEAQFVQVVAKSPTNYQARMLLGMSYYQQNKLKEAVAQLETVLNAQPDNVAAAYALSTAYINLGQVEKARPLVDQVFRRTDTAEGHFIVGLFYLANKDFPNAISELNTAAQFNPRLPTLHSQLGEAWLFSGNRDQAEKEFAQEIQTNPRDFNANVRLGWLYREDGRLDEAEKLLKTALDLRPEDIAALYQLGQLAQARGATAEAVGLLERVVKRAPDFSPAHVLLARLYFKVNRSADAERERAIIQKLTEQQQKKNLLTGNPADQQLPTATTGTAANEPKKP